MRCNSGRTISIYDLGSLTGQAFNLAMTPQNILSGFQSSGIYPLNPDVFTEQDYLPSDVTDRLEVTQGDCEMDTAPTSEPEATATTTAAACSPPQPSQSTSAISQHTSPADIIPLPKAKPRRNSTNRRRIKSAIITDTPDKDRRLAEQEASKSKGKAKKKRMDPIPDSSSDEDGDLAVPLATDSDSCAEVEETDQAEAIETQSLVQGVHILVKYVTERGTAKYYAGVIDEVCDGELRVSYLRKKQGSAAQFVYPDKVDIDVISHDTVELVLGTPIAVGGTSRSVQSVMFPVDISSYCVE